MSEVEVPAVAKKIKTFFKKLAIFLKKLAVFFENDLIFLRNTLVFEHVVFIYVRISLYNCIGLWICTYVKECVLLERETLAHYIFMFLRVIPTLDLASAYVDEGGFYGGIFC